MSKRDKASRLAESLRNPTEPQPPVMRRDKKGNAYLKALRLEIELKQRRRLKP
jgi:hypothetical protein